MATVLSQETRPGQSELTRREVEVLSLLFQGKSTQEVAEMMFVSKRTVDYHLCRIFEKLNVSNRVQAILRAAQMGLVEAPPGN